MMLKFSENAYRVKSTDASNHDPRIADAQWFQLPVPCARRKPVLANGAKGSFQEAHTNPMSPAKRFLQRNHKAVNTKISMQLNKLAFRFLVYLAFGLMFLFGFGSAAAEKGLGNIQREMGPLCNADILGYAGYKYSAKKLFTPLGWCFTKLKKRHFEHWGLFLYVQAQNGQGPTFMVDIRGETKQVAIFVCDLLNKGKKSHLNLKRCYGNPEAIVSPNFKKRQCWMKSLELSKHDFLAKLQINPLEHVTTLKSMVAKFKGNKWSKGSLKLWNPEDGSMYLCQDFAFNLIRYLDDPQKFANKCEYDGVEFKETSDIAREERISDEYLTELEKYRKIFCRINPGSGKSFQNYIDFLGLEMKGAKRRDLIGEGTGYTKRYEHYLIEDRAKDEAKTATQKPNDDVTEHKMNCPSCGETFRASLAGQGKTRVSRVRSKAHKHILQCYLKNTIVSKDIHGKIVFRPCNGS